MGRAVPKVLAAACIVLIAAAAWCAGGPPADRQGAPCAAESAEHPWPDVDWDALREANPDVVGYITIPGTGVSEPVVAAREGDPYHYLAHDWTGAADPSGAIALDAEAQGDLLAEDAAHVAAIYGHHMSDGTRFADVAGYNRQDYADAHGTAYLQAPGRVAVLKFAFSEVIEGSDAAKRCRFGSDGEYRAWIGQRKARARADAGGAIPARMVCLCTCSYTTYADERTLAYFAIKEIQEIEEE